MPVSGRAMLDAIIAGESDPEVDRAETAVGNAVAELHQRHRPSTIRRLIRRLKDLGCELPIPTLA